MIRKKCAVQGCTRPMRCRRRCGPHYRQWHRSDPTAAQANYEAKVDRSAGPDACHPWTASLNQFGYGMFGHDGESLAVRWAYKNYIGPLGRSEVIRHTCDNRSCQNRSHWVKGTQAQNVEDAVSRNRQWQPKGEKNVKAKLTESQVLEIRESLEPRKYTAARFGVCLATVCSIQRRKTWAHLP